MRFSRVFLVGALSLALFACGPKSYTLKLHPKEGETYNYSVDLTGPQSMQMHMAMKATKVTDQQTVLETHLTDMQMGGKALDMSKLFKDMVITVTEDSTGHVTNTDVAGVPDALAASMKSQGASVNNTIFPDHPVKIGDTWTGTSKVQGKDLSFTYKLTKVEPVNGKEAAVIEATADASSSLKFDGPMIVNIELATGMPLSSKMTMDVNGQKESVAMTRQ